MNVLVVKARIRERDGMRCTECGMTNVEHLAAYGRSLDVHRVVPGSEYNESPGVCVTLCRPCHVPKPKLPSGTHPGSMVRIRGRLAAEAELAAAENGQSFTQYVNDAVRMRLQSEGRWPPTTR